MTDDNNTVPTTQRGPRRSSFAGQTFADLFGSGRSAPRNIPNNENQAPQYPGPIASAAAQAQRRRMSLTTVGLSGSSPNSTSPFNSLRGHRDSISSANSGSIDESAIEDDKDGSVPTTPFARRMSFGARAMRDIRTSTGGNGGGGGGGGSPGQNNGEGFNWSDNLRTRAERSSSIAGPAGGGQPLGAGNHARAKSVATMEPPVQEMPRAPPQKPDHFQERILKGDFYMD